MPTPLTVLVLQASAFTWFVVQTRSGELTPYSIRHVVKPMTALPGEHMQQQLLNLVQTVKDDYGRMDLCSMWRPYGRCVHADNTTSMPAWAEETFWRVNSEPIVDACSSIVSVLLPCSA